MAETIPFTGQVACSQQLELGEGPTFDPVTGTAWWFDILGRELHELHLATGIKRVHALPVMASVLARIDDTRQLLATEQGLFLRDAGSGALTPHAVLEADKPGNRSNDGRVHPSGSLWIGTMGRKAEKAAGSIYHVSRGKVTRLFGDISITNAICFSPDGTKGHFVDTLENRLMRVELDPATGLPTGKPALFIDEQGKPGGMDGAVCDADGHLWNARWGTGRIDRYDTAGTLVARYAVPGLHSSCPAFVGDRLDRMLVTTAHEGLDKAADPANGATYILGVPVRGVVPASYRL
nr:SMP-30/gluconolactonase/LRE family protein [uncultured Gellertiella sp.]